MARVVMYPGRKGRWMADSDVVPRVPEVQAVLRARAAVIYGRARAVLAAHRDTGRSRITAPRRAVVDWHVGLDGPGPSRALYIEGNVAPLRRALGRGGGRVRRRGRGRVRRGRGRVSGRRRVRLGRPRRGRR